MEKFWLKYYPPGVPAEINPDAYSSIVEVIDRSVQQFADCPAFYNLGMTISYRDLKHDSDALAAYFQQVLRLQRGDRVAIILPNILQYPVTLYAILKVGLVVVNVNPLYTTDELTFQLNDAGVKAAVVLANMANTLQKALPRVPSLKHVMVTQLPDLHKGFKRPFINLLLKLNHQVPPWRIRNAIPFRAAIQTGKALKLEAVDLQNQDIAFLQYTGGTTGVSKGAILTHRNLIANLEQADAWFPNTLMPGKEIVISPLPYYHIFSLLANCLFFMKKGGLNVLITNPRDVPRMISEMKKFKFTAITGVNTLFMALLNDPRFHQLDFSALHMALGGGMAVQRQVAERWEAVTRVPLIEGYGLTEASPCVAINPYNLKHFSGAIGLPAPSTDVAFLDDEGKEVPLHERGELAVKGPQVMQGYWHNPTETAKVFTPDGWLLTGDIAAIDEQGFIRILERKKDMILVSGFNVYPHDIEEVLMSVPGIRECAVIGIPDPHTGEAVKAFIVKSDPALTVATVLKQCREHLTPYKVPKYVEFRSDLPKSHVGKILRRVLKEEATAHTMA